MEEKSLTVDFSNSLNVESIDSKLELCTDLFTSLSINSLLRLYRLATFFRFLFVGFHVESKNLQETCCRTDFVEISSPFKIKSRCHKVF